MPFLSKNPFRRLLPVLISVILVLGILPFEAAPAAAAQGVIAQNCTLLYAVQSGDTLTSIGSRFSTTANNLYTLNPVLRNRDAIFPGLVLCLSNDPNASLPGFPGLPPTGAAPGITITQVNPGRTITLAGSDFVANTPYSVQMYRFGAANPAVYRVADFNAPANGTFSQTLAIPPQLSNAERIQVRVITASGQIVASAAFINRFDTGTPAANCNQYHTVQGGDTLSSISRQYNVSVQQLALLNNLVDISLIFPGQRLCLRAGQPDNPPVGWQGQPAFWVIDVDYNQDVTVGGMYFPRQVPINVDIGVAGSNPASFVNVANFTLPRSDDGHFMKTFRIPDALRGQPDLVVRATRADNNQFLSAGFRNVRSSGADPDNFPLASSSAPPDPSAMANEANQRQAQSAGQARTLALRSGRSANLNLGGAGVYTERAVDDGAVLQATPIDPHRAPTEGLIFTQPLLLVNVIDANGQPVQQVNGDMYVYFDVTSDLRQQYDVSQMNIYTYDFQDNAWEPCDTQVPVNEQGPELDRLACQMESLGLFGVAIQP